MVCGSELEWGSDVESTKYIPVDQRKVRFEKYKNKPWLSFFFSFI